MEFSGDVDDPWRQEGWVARCCGYDLNGGYGFSKAGVMAGVVISLPENDGGALFGDLDGDCLMLSPLYLKTTSGDVNIMASSGEDGNVVADISRQIDFGVNGVARVSGLDLGLRLWSWNA